ncbi:MAG TPA: spermidine synthase, partial [Bacteroidia bacterium]|nr:spermidine synthase [Bacteroidia bacterium]
MAKRYSVFQWLFSFITPVIIHKDQSEVNSILETTLENGKLVLNSAHANYSYGSLFRVFIKALLRFNIDIKNKKKILVLGMGGGSVVK